MHFIARDESRIDWQWRKETVLSDATDSCRRLENVLNFSWEMNAAHEYSIRVWNVCKRCLRKFPILNVVGNPLLSIVHWRFVFFPERVFRRGGLVWMSKSEIWESSSMEDSYWSRLFDRFWLVCSCCADGNWPKWFFSVRGEQFVFRSHRTGVWSTLSLSF